MKNNHGITLIELIISIALISIVIVFLFQLLVDVKYSENKLDYTKDFQQQRAVIVKNIQEDFINYGLEGLSDQAKIGFSDTTEILFSFGATKESRLKVRKNAIEYQNVSGITEVWEIPDNIFFDCALPVKIIGLDIENQDNIAVSIKIPLNIKDKTENVMDDLEIFFLGKKESIFLDKQFMTTSILGKSCP